MADDVKVLPDTNEARTADPEVPDFGTNYVETGLHLLADFDAGLLSVSAGAALHSFNGDLYYATNINRRTGQRRLSIPSGTTGVYYDFEARSLVMGDPGEPALQIGSVDASGETVDETINRTRDVAIGDANVETVSGGDGDFDSVNTEQLTGVADRIIDGGASVTEINDALSQSHTVLLAGDHTGLADSLEITADDVTLIIGPSATVKIADDANPTVLLGNKGQDRVPLLKATNQNNLTIDIRGTLDANNTNHPKTVGVLLKGDENGNGCHNSGVFDTNGGEIVDAQDCAFFADSDDLSFDLQSQNYDETVVAAEGCFHFTGTSKGSNGNEVLDLNGGNYGYDVTATGRSLDSEVIDIDGINGVCTVHGQDVGALVDCSNGNSTFRFSNREGFPDADDTPIRATINAYGQSRNTAIRLQEGAEDDPMKDITINGRVIAETGNAVTAITEYEDQLNGLSINGYYETRGGAGAIQIGDGDANVRSESIKIDAVLRHTGTSECLTLLNVTGVTGRVVVPRSSGKAAFIGSGCDDIDLHFDVEFTNVTGVEIDGASDVTLRGAFRETNQESILINAGSTDTDIRADFQIITDNGTRTRRDGVIGGGELGGVDLSATTGQKEGDRAVASGASAANEGDKATWDSSVPEWRVFQPDVTV
jgi:hypothetical protein